MANFDQNHGLTPLEKSQFFDFLNFLFLQPRKAFFVVEYRKTHFPGPYCKKKETMGKWSIFEKPQFFDFFNFLFLQPRKAFFVLEYRKTHFPGPYCLKAKDEKMANF